MKKYIVGTICMLLIITTVLPVTGKLNKLETEYFVDYINIVIDEYPLPSPLSVDMVLEESFCRRMSVRSFTEESVTDEELSTILWACYGVTENGNRSIFNPNDSYSTIIYVIRSDATYKYVPENHSLSLFKTGNYLHLGQYTSPIKIGLVWDMDIESDELRGMIDIGMICQNIYFDANALDLGTVTTGSYVEDLYELGIPSNEKPEIIMPLGHPSTPYDFTYDPLPEQNLPLVINNTLSLEDAINNRLIKNKWDDIPLSLLEESQLIWSSYGYSYLFDNVNNKRHRTLPSSWAIYPFKIFAANHSGVYQYSPSHSISEIVAGDQRQKIKNFVESNNITIESASWIIIPFLDTDLGGSQFQKYWYYELGALINNILLETAALNLSANVIYDISDETGLRSALGLSSQPNLRPLSIIPVGNPFSDSNNPPEIPDIDGPTNGVAGTEYTYIFNSVDPDGDDVYYYIKWGDGHIEYWDGPHQSGLDIEITHTYVKQGTYLIEAKAKDTSDTESDWNEFEVTIPRTRTSSYLLFELLLERFPILERLLSLLL
ncbi:MAG: nitroreductase family protein [Thermoplasmatales archaeon]|nr:MAG: nitroreductase family protein [Thermoplasmatales archaeon]